ncbi:hypothetical protein QBC36DRAFT_295864 [Triangularia setosa]|uniref:Uncharacterized protein n=1 Tax=Triangularia setosa TaxID=2587417 RepID=A0AAN7A2G9_9PEZI|nr:hypothetical protein QBC36DRAFT_295864 [Podospora setosa]
MDLGNLRPHEARLTDTQAAQVERKGSGSSYEGRPGTLQPKVNPVKAHLEGDDHSAGSHSTDNHLEPHYANTEPVRLAGTTLEYDSKGKEQWIVPEEKFKQQIRDRKWEEAQQQWLTGFELLANPEREDALAAAQRLGKGSGLSRMPANH